MFKAILSRPALALAGLALLLGGAADTAKAAWYQKTDFNNHSAGQYFFPAWTNGWNTSNGYLTRTYEVTNGGTSVPYLWLNFKQTGSSVGNSGFDAGVGRGVSARRVSELTNTNSSEINYGVYYRFTEKINARRSDDFWIQGPKTVVTETNGWSGLDGQYECYIVDNSNKSRDWIVNHYGLTWRSSGNYDGTTYHFYTRDLYANGETIKQIFTMRQNWRSTWTQDGKRICEGWVPTNWIMRQWRTSGIIPWDGNGKTWYCLGWKVNIETEGEFWSSEAGWSYLSLPWN